MQTDHWEVGPSQVKCTLPVSPSKDKSSEVHPEPRAASSDPQEVSVIDLGVDEVLLRCVDRSRK